MPKTVFLCGLGAMGRKHLAALLRAGYRVTALDPAPDARELARAIAKDETAGSLAIVDAVPRVAFDLAVFAEPAPARGANLERFLDEAGAARVLLEKPVAASVTELRRAAARLGARAQVNLSRRAWPFTHRLRALAEPSREIVVTLNGGAKGIGCNAVHYLDLFLLLAGGDGARIAYSRLSPLRVPSPRGAEFSDFGGTFLVESGRGTFFASLAAESSAAPVFSVRGDHFIAWVDESDWTYRVQARRADSSLPNYRYGRDYEVIESGSLAPPAPESITAAWARGEAELPSLDDAAVSHELLFEILGQGGAEPPYHFT